MIRRDAVGNRRCQRRRLMALDIVRQPGVTFVSRPLVPLMVTVFLVAVCAVLVPSARAAPAAYYQLSGNASQTVGTLMAGSDGSLWLAQSGTEGRFKLLHLDTSGHLLAESPEQNGSPSYLPMVPASDGGAWLRTAGGLEHIAPDGSSSHVPAVPVGAQTLVSGQDGRAWLGVCGNELHEETCEALAVSLAGEVENYPLSGMSTYWPEVNGSMSYRSVPTEDGVWFSKLVRQGTEPPVASAEYLSYSGEEAPVALPRQANLVAPSTDDAAWWKEDRGDAGAVLGRIGTSGATSDIHTLANRSSPSREDVFTAAAGQHGNLAWAQNTPWNEGMDGQIGVARPDGSNSAWSVPKDATAVPIHDEPAFAGQAWSLSCQFGVWLHEGTDGSLWTISSGRPSRLTRQQPDGQFSTFVLGRTTDVSEDSETGIGGMVETDPHALWFTVETSSGPELARLDPLDPPPAVPRYPGALNNTTEGSGAPVAHPPTRVRRAAAMQHFLKSLLFRARKKIKLYGRLGHRQLHGHRWFKIHSNFPTHGTLVISLRTGSHRHVRRLAFGRHRGAAGKRVTAVRFFRKGRVLLKDGRRQRAHLEIRFKIRGRGIFRRAVGMWI